MQTRTVQNKTVQNNSIEKYKVSLHSRYLGKINGKITVSIKPLYKLLLIMLQRYRSWTKGKDFCLEMEVKISARIITQSFDLVAL